MEKIYQHRSIYFFYITLLAISLYFLMFYTKSAIHLYINSFHTISADFFFKNITHLGDGIFGGLVSLGLFFVSYRWGLTMLMSNILAGITAQFFKRVVFSGSARPSTFFEDTTPLHFVEGVQLHGFNSMPSGHTATAFGLFFVLILLVEKKHLQYLFLTLAVLVGFSRVYISQHFLADIVVGSVIGVLWASMTYVFFERLSNKKLDKSLRDVFRR